ncbi:uncharacterized protein LOC112686154 isoform X2 [Sipha flava]|uniref:Uncharacterized protein LOC112686154 isoform X2 n=1 Tax=Sipha flava TaxID=143950 RepID=A0A8B8FTK3_9HEMI|nr:uncharacterized protein LOC112686154 isoform X2 [Sipha flava]
MSATFLEVMQIKSQDSRHQKISRDCEQLLDDDHRILNKEFNMLRKESVNIFLSCEGDLDVANRTQAYLEKVTKKFHCQLSLINSMDCTQQHKTLLLEHLKKLFIRNVCQMDKWISLVIEAK